MFFPNGIRRTNSEFGRPKIKNSISFDLSQTPKNRQLNHGFFTLFVPVIEAHVMPGFFQVNGGDLPRLARALLHGLHHKTPVRGQPFALVPVRLEVIPDHAENFLFSNRQT
jgi:hypothetical protein